MTNDDPVTTPAASPSEAQGEAREIAEAMAREELEERPQRTARADTLRDAWSEGARLRERWAPYVAGALLALPVLLAAYPPMTDLPLHEAGVAILRHFDDASMFPPGLYFRNFGHPNQMFHIAAYLLSFAMSTAMACKIVIAIAVASLPVAAAHLASHVGASRWTALVVAPLALGWLFFMGLVANIIGLVLLLALFPMLDTFLAKPTARGAAKAFGGAVLLYFGHEAMMFDYAAAILLFTLAYPIRVRETAMRLAIFVACVAITYAQLLYQAPLWTKSTAAVQTVFMPLRFKFIGLPGVLLGAYDLQLSIVLLSLLGIIMVALLGQRVWEHVESKRGFPAGWRARLHRYRFEVFALCLVAAYLAFPATLNSATFVYHRFLPPAFAVAAIVVSPRRLDAIGDASPIDARIHRFSALLAGLAPVVSILVVWPAFADQSQNFAEIERLTPFIEKGSAVAAVAAGTMTTHGFVKPTMAVRAVTDRGGRMLYSFAESPISPVMIRREYQWPEPIERIVPSEVSFCPVYDLTRFRYLLLHTSDPQLEYIVTQALKPEAKVVEVAGNWALYESTLPVVPLLSADGVPPAPCPHGTLGARMDRASAALRDLMMRGQKEPK